MRRHLNAGYTLSTVVRLFSICACLLLSTPLFAQEPKPRATLKGHSSSIRSLAFSPDGKTLASGDSNEFTMLWDVTNGQYIGTYTDHGHSVSFSPDGKTLAAEGNSDGSIKLLDLATGKDTPLHNKSLSRGCTNLVFSPDGKALASGGICNEEINLWDVTAGKLTATLKGYDAYGIRAMGFSPDSKKLFTMGRHDGMKIWDTVTGIETASRKSPELVVAAAFSPDVKTLATASGDDDNIVRLCDVATGKEKALFKGHDATVWSLAFSSDGKTLASASFDKSVKVWDVATGKLKVTFNGHKNDRVLYLYVAFSPDGRILASGGEDKTIKLWDVPTNNK
jgi:WD40 repeat protein